MGGTGCDIGLSLPDVDLLFLSFIIFTSIYHLSFPSTISRYPTFSFLHFFYCLLFESIYTISFSFLSLLIYVSFSLLSIIYNSRMMAVFSEKRKIWICLDDYITLC